MLKQTQVYKSTKKPWIIAGVLLSLTIVGVSGCGSTSTSSSPATSTTQSASSSQQNQGTTDQKAPRNPALQAVMEISRLQRDPQNALTSDQKAKIKPILQELISTPNLSQESLQQKADAINAVLTDQQKTNLATPRTPNGTKQNPNGQNGNSANGNRPQGGTGGKQAGNAPKPEDMYQRVLDSLK